MPAPPPHRTPTPWVRHRIAAAALAAAPAAAPGATPAAAPATGTTVGVGGVNFDLEKAQELLRKNAGLLGAVAGMAGYKNAGTLLNTAINQMGNTTTNSTTANSATATEAEKQAKLQAELERKQREDGERNEARATERHGDDDGDRRAAGELADGEYVGGGRG